MNTLEYFCDLRRHRREFLTLSRDEYVNPDLRATLSVFYQNAYVSLKKMQWLIAKGTRHIYVLLCIVVRLFFLDSVFYVNASYDKQRSYCRAILFVKVRLLKTSFIKPLFCGLFHG